MTKIGVYVIIYEVELQLYATVAKVTQAQAFTVTVKDRCTSGNGLQVISPTKTDPVKYYYDGVPLEFAPDGLFTSSDVNCPIATHTC